MFELANQTFGLRPQTFYFPSQSKSNCLQTVFKLPTNSPQTQPQSGVTPSLQTFVFSLFCSLSFLDMPSHQVRRRNGSRAKRLEDWLRIHLQQYRGGPTILALRATAALQVPVSKQMVWRVLCEMGNIHYFDLYDKI